MNCVSGFSTEVGNSEELIDRGAKIIGEGGLVAFPTETVYGLGADAFNAEAVTNIFIAKGRPQDNPLIVHVSCPQEARKVARSIPEVAYKLWERFSPGPLTIILPKVDELPLTTTAGLQTVGIRIPNNRIALELIRRSGCPIAAPSANSSGRISPTTAQHVYEDMAGKIPIILDGGATDVGIESTVLDLTKPVPTVLRPGAITVEMLAPILGKVVNHQGKVVIAEAPGMKYKHYAPIVKCVSARSPETAEACAKSVGRGVVIARPSFLARISDDVDKISIGETPEECMRHAFSAMRDAEKIYDVIVLEYFGDEEAFYALHNRLNKSTGGVVLDDTAD